MYVIYVQGYCTLFVNAIRTLLLDRLLYTVYVIYLQGYRTLFVNAIRTLLLDRLLHNVCNIRTGLLHSVC